MSVIEDINNKEALLSMMERMNKTYDIARAIYQWWDRMEDLCEPMRDTISSISQDTGYEGGFRYPQESFKVSIYTTKKAIREKRFNALLDSVPEPYGISQRKDDRENTVITVTFSLKEDLPISKQEFATWSLATIINNTRESYETDLTNAKFRLRSNSKDLLKDNLCKATCLRDIKESSIEVAWLEGLLTSFKYRFGETEACYNEVLNDSRIFFYHDLLCVLSNLKISNWDDLSYRRKPQDIYYEYFLYGKIAGLFDWKEGKEFPSGIYLAKVNVKKELKKFFVES